MSLRMLKSFLVALLVCVAVLCAAPAPVSAAPLQRVAKVLTAPVRLAKRFVGRCCRAERVARGGCSGDSCH